MDIFEVGMYFVGAKVYVTCRSQTKCETLVKQMRSDTNKSVYPLVLELSSTRSIHKCAQQFKQCKNKSLIIAILTELTITTLSQTIKESCFCATVC